MIELYEYQREALTKLRTGSILCGGVGSGKSRTSLAYYFENYPNKKLYIITTARKRDTGDWVDEIVLFDGLEVESIDSWNNIKKYSEVQDAFFIFDEQRVVGYGAWTHAFLKIAKNNDWILLSATPGDVWIDYVPVFIANGFFKNKTDFCNKHVIWARYSKYPQIKGYFNQRVLNDYRNQVLVKMDYKKHTESHHIVVSVLYDRMMYKIIQKNRKNPFNEMKPIKNISEFCFVLRKIVNSDEDRVNTAINLVEEHGRAIIFYRYDFELELLTKELMSRKIIFSCWNGHQHDLVPSNEKWAYLVQYTAGAEGWNCIETDTMIFYSDDYSYKVMVQAAGRIDRLNTPFNDLYYYHLRSSSPIDRAIATSLATKKNFNESKFVKI